MITRDQFRLQLDRLIDTYGDKPFSDQREALIWEKIDGLDYASVIKIVDNFIATARQAPLPADFAKAANDYTRTSKRYSLGEVKPRELASCSDCLDSGLRAVTYRGASGWGPCQCPRGAQLIEADQRRTRPIGFKTQYGPHWHEGETA